MSMLDGNKQQFQTPWGLEALYSTVRGRQGGSARTKCLLFYGASLFSHTASSESNVWSRACVTSGCGDWLLLHTVTLLSKKMNVWSWESRTQNVSSVSNVVSAAGQRFSKMPVKKTQQDNMFLLHVNTRGSTGGTWPIQCQVIINSETMH